MPYLKSSFIILAIILSLLSCSLSAAPGDYLWSFKTGAQNWGSPLVKDHIAYFGSDNGTFYALDIEQPKLRWQFKTSGKLRGKPAINNHRIFFASDDGHLYVLNRWSGKELWRADLKDKDVFRHLPANHAPWEFDYNKSSPVIEGQSVYIGSASGDFFSFNKNSGELRWQFKASDKIRSSPAVNIESVIFSDWRGKTYALDKHNGELKWLHESQSGIASSPLISGNKVLIGSRDTNLYALDVSNGNEIWRLTYPGGSWVESSAVLGEEKNTFYIGSSDSNILIKGDLTTGDIIWTFNTTGWSWGTPTIKNGAVYIGAVGHAEPGWYETHRGFFVVDAKTGKEKWRYHPALVDGFINGGVHATPTIINGKVIVPDLDGYIHVYSE